MEQLLCTVLSMQGRVNYRQLSYRMTYHEYTIKRWFEKEEGFAFRSFHGHVLEEAKLGGRVIAAMDASFIPKSGKHTEGLGHFHNGCRGKAEKGLELSAIALVYEECQSAFVLDVMQTLDSEVEKLEVENPSRMHLYAKQWQEALPDIPAEVNYLVVDGAYSKQSFVDAVVSDDPTQRRVDIIGKLRKDADLWYVATPPETGPRPRGRPRKYDGKVDLSTLERFTVVSTSEEDGVTVYHHVCWHRSLKRKLTVVVRRHHASGRQQLFFSTDTSLSATDLLTFYRMRFHIEFLFRDAKQHTGLTTCQARNSHALTFHFNLALAAVNLAKLHLRSQQPHHTPLVSSLASYKEQLARSRLLSLFFDYSGLDPTQPKIADAFSHLVLHDDTLPLAA